MIEDWGEAELRILEAVMSKTYRRLEFVTGILVTMILPLLKIFLVVMTSNLVVVPKDTDKCLGVHTILGRVMPMGTPSYSIFAIFADSNELSEKTASLGALCTMLLVILGIFNGCQLLICNFRKFDSFINFEQFVDLFHISFILQNFFWAFAFFFQTHCLTTYVFIAFMGVLEILALILVRFTKLERKRVIMRVQVILDKPKVTFIATYKHVF